MLIQDKHAVEQRLLIQSAILMSFVAIGGTMMGVFSGSSAILLDGVVSFIAVIIKVMMIITSRLVSNETSKRFQFGYWQFEPLVLIAEGSFTLLIVSYAFLSGLTDLLGGGRAVHVGPAIIYATIFTIADTCYYFYVHQINKKLTKIPASNMASMDQLILSNFTKFDCNFLLIWCT